MQDLSFEVLQGIEIMIIVKLSGGLGNQMFQYAAARSLAEKRSTILKLDITGYDHDKLRKYGLHCFQIKEHLATQTEIGAIRGSQSIFARIKRKVSSKIVFKGSGYRRWIFERHFHFDPDILSAPNDVYLEGCWQSERYFADISDVLRHEFVVRYKPDPQNQKLADLIQCADSVSLHVRRSDYIYDSITNKTHGTCGKDYYERSVNYIASHISSPNLFIFSDEPQWAKDNLKFDLPKTFVDCNDDSRNYEDLRLMSLCKHNIIANSSFSWWGAWLNSNANKIVVAPKKWFNDNTRNTKDLIPEQWVRL